MSTDFYRMLRVVNDSNEFGRQMQSNASSARPGGNAMNSKIHRHCRRRRNHAVRSHPRHVADHLNADAALNAMADAGLKLADIDSVATAGETPMVSPPVVPAQAGILGLKIPAVALDLAFAGVTNAALPRARSASPAPRPLPRPASPTVTSTI